MFVRVALGLSTALVLAVPALAGSARSLSIFVSRDTQQLAVFDGDEIVATSNVSTGKPGHSTPTGIFTVIEKQEYHESNLYSSAPMPFMQRITWSGVALHESNSVPRHPASHGCVRLPHKFAKKLYGLTEMGIPVVIADEELTPSLVTHPLLFRPLSPKDPAGLLSDAKLRLAPISDFMTPTEVALNDATPPVKEETSGDDRKGLRILITRRGQGEDVKDIQIVLASLGYNVGEPDGQLGRRTIAAINAFKLTHDLPVHGPLLTDAIEDEIFKAGGRQRPPLGHIFVRRDFKPLFDSPITLKAPEKALGTHFLQLKEMDAELGLADWYGVTMSDGLTKAQRTRFGITSKDPETLSGVMDRIQMPEEIRNSIEASLTVGSTITITDTGLGIETGKEGTDFITLTNPPEKDG